MDEDERSLLSKGPNFIAVTSLMDKFTAKEDSKKFFRHLRLKAHFTELAVETHETADSVNGFQHQSGGEITIPPTSSDTSPAEQSTTTKVILQSFNPKKSKWSPPPGKFSALDHYIDKCHRDINQLNLKEKCRQ